MMGEGFQVGHLDAEELNAFMEDALAVTERERALAHLATCADCRMVLALATGAEESPAAEVVKTPRRWVPVWVWGLPVAAVLGVVFFMVDHGARVVREPVEQAVGNAPAALVAASPAQPGMKAPPGVGGAPMLVAPPPQVARARQKTMDAGDLVELPAAGRTVAQTAEGPAKIPQVAGALTLGAAMPAPAAPAGVVMAAPGAPPMSSTTARSAVAQGQGRASAAAAKPAVSVDQDSNASAAVLTGSALDALSDDARAVAGVSALRPLPSGFPAISSTTAAGAMVALDNAGHLFVTRDGGSHWTAVDAKWKGKAVGVGLVGAAQVATSQAMVSVEASAAVLQGAGSASSVTGVVRDATGAAIPGAAVMLKERGGAVVGTTATDKNGRYSVRVAAGSYSVDAQETGFEEESVSIVVPAGTQFNQNLTLKVGAMSETVEVSAASPMLPGETRGADRKKKAVPVFELVTETGERWVSVDGVRWGRK